MVPRKGLRFELKGLIPLALRKLPAFQAETVAVSSGVSGWPLTYFINGDNDD